MVSGLYIVVDQLQKMQKSRPDMEPAKTQNNPSINHSKYIKIFGENNH